MQDEQATSHYFLELLEHLDGHVDEGCQHLIIDLGVAQADDAWLEDTTPVVDEHFSLFHVEPLHQLWILKVFTDLRVDVFADRSQRLRQLFTIKLFNCAGDAAREGKHRAAS